MQSKALFALFTLFVASASAMPAQDIGDMPTPLVVRGCPSNNAISWKAKGGCKTSWGGKCHSICRGEGIDRKCCNGSVTSSIGGACFVGWNTCNCACTKE